MILKLCTVRGWCEMLNKVSNFSSREIWNSSTGWTQVNFETKIRNMKSKKVSMRKLKKFTGREARDLQRGIVASIAKAKQGQLRRVNRFQWIRKKWDQMYWLVRVRVKVTLCSTKKKKNKKNKLWDLCLFGEKERKRLWKQSVGLKNDWLIDWLIDWLWENERKKGSVDENEERRGE